MNGSSPTGRVRFGESELDLRTGELLNKGHRIKLQDQPFQILVILLEHAGDLVTRQELIQKLWPNNTFVDFDHSLNKAINKLRLALEDSAESPRFVETLARRGYRFIGTVEAIAAEPGSNEPSQAGAVSLATASSTKSVRSLRSLWALAVVSLLLVAIVAVGPHFSRRRPRITSIAVLPLANMSGDPQQDYFSDGITDEVIHMLTQIQALRVTSRTSTMQYKGTHKSIPQIARELNVDAIIEGSVLRSGDRVRISVDLIDGVADRNIWTARYERDLRDVLALQGDVAREVAREIDVTLTEREHQRLSRTEAVNPAARESFLWGRYFLTKATETAARKSVDYFQAAIREQPRYVEAYTGLAEAYQELSFYDSPQTIALEAKAATMKALEIDETSAAAHAALAWIQWTYDWNWAGAEGEFHRAIDLDPGNAEVHDSYGAFLNSKGRLQEAQAEHKLAERFDPLSLHVRMSLAEDSYLAHRYDDATRQYRDVIEIDPHDPTAHECLGHVYAQMGMQEAAVAEWAQSAAEYGFTDLADKFREVYAKSGYQVALRWELDQITRREKGGTYESAFHIAAMWARLGRTDKTLEWLRRAYQNRDSDLVFIGVNPVFDQVRQDPRFGVLLNDIGLGSETANIP